MKVINLFAGPRVGKSTLAAGVFYELRKNQISVELDFNYEQHFEDQFYILAKQYRKLNMLQNFEYAITDSPLLQTVIYNNPEKFNQILYEQVALELYNKYNNINFLIERNNKDFTYQKWNCNESITEALLYDEKIKSLLDKNNIPYTTLKSNRITVTKIINKIFEINLSKE